MNQDNILVVEDEIEIAKAIEIYLKSQGYNVYIANNGKAGLEMVERYDIHLAIVDIMMPVMDGIEMTMKIRENYDFPVIFLSAKSEDIDKITGLNIGGDDYVTKPFEIQELLMRIQAISRRRIHQDILRPHAGNLSFDSNTCEISNTSTGKSMKISGKEMQLCEFLLINQNQVLEKEQIATKIWGYDSNAEYNNVEVYISFLRRKFHHLQVNVTIRAVRGVGYILEVAND